MPHAIFCYECGAKMRAGRERCPRCRAWVQAPDTKAAASAVAVRSRRLQWISAGIVGAFVLLVGVLWLIRDPAPPPISVPAHPADLLAHKRSPKLPEAPAMAGTPAAEAPPFLDPSGAGALAYHAGDYDKALREFQEAVERNPQDAESLSNLGQVLVRLGRVEEAIPYFERAIQILPSRWAYHFNRARALGLMGKWDEAIAGYRHAQTLFPNDYATTFNLALALHKKGDEAGAIEEYKKAIELSPDDASFRLALATSYERVNKTTDAAAAYQEYLRLSPDGADADKVKARIAMLTASGGRETGSGSAGSGAASTAQGPG